MRFLDIAVYISDTNNNRIQIFDTDGNVINSFGGNGSQQGMFSSPEGVAVDNSGNIYRNVVWHF
ncbi:MAG: hypothetical protein HQL02_11020 [Nitrospirae bacterium]|nr:hypothetical protein [Nitrospirota bacterium]